MSGLIVQMLQWGKSGHTWLALQHDAYWKLICCQTYRNAEPRNSYCAVDQCGPYIDTEEIALCAAVVDQQCCKSGILSMQRASVSYISHISHRPYSPHAGY